ncbi:MAG: beta-N-acetylhexosaminidase [Promethearchaeota archaeon]
MEPKSNDIISIIPKPVRIDIKQGNFILNGNTLLVTAPSLKYLAEYLKGLIAPATGLELVVKDLGKKDEESNTIILNIEKNEGLLNPEGYVLEVDQKKIKITGSMPQGVFYAIQTLRQLLPVEIESVSKIDREWFVPCVRIEDFSRFNWRGFMLDESRHFFGKENVKKLLDIMASLKFNTFHWHLTDDQGWRIEIKKYPRLIEIGSKRKGTFVNRKKLDGIPISGSYTQDEIKEIIEYASERFITIIPEIDVPGHVTAALAAYPELSCTGGPFEVSTRFGIFEDVLCIGKEKVFNFVQDVLKEVMELFPSKIIHIGGDEVPRTRWKECISCQARVNKEDLQSEEDLQVYFTNRIAEYLASNEHRLMGWNEILNHKLVDNAICHYWNENFDFVLENARKGREIVMSEMEAVYLNFQYSTTPLIQTYEYNPIPDELENKFHEKVLGLEACLWTEYVKNEKHLEFQVFPRLIAVAETGWTLKKNKDYHSFLTRLNDFIQRLGFHDVNYAPKETYLKENAKF